jgi:hypothetical protein
MSGNSNDDRRIQARLKLQKKVEVLESLLLDGIPPGTALPMSLSALRKWEDNSLGVERIGSPGTTNRRISPHLDALISRATTAIQRLRQAKKTKTKIYTPIGEKLRRANCELATQAALNRALVSQIAQLRHSLTAAIAEREQTVAARAQDQAVIAQLRRSLIQADRRMLSAVTTEKEKQL